MQHYLLIAELEIIVNALDEIAPEKHEEFISGKRLILKAAKSRFPGIVNRIKINSGKEVEYLRPHVTEAVNVLNKFNQSATGDKKKLLDKYSWCQLWCAAKEDAQRQWGVKEVTYTRHEW